MERGFSLREGCGDPGRTCDTKCFAGRSGDQPGSEPGLRGKFNRSSSLSLAALRVTGEAAYAGAQAVTLQRHGATGNLSFLYQDGDISKLRGRRLRLQVALRADAGSWLRPFVEVRQPGKEARTRITGGVATRWSLQEIFIDVPLDAERLRYGVIAQGESAGAVDAFSLEDFGPAGAGNEPPRPLSARGRDNLLAFLHILGVVRYFHPSDQAASLDWEHFVISAVHEVERVASPAELQATLARLFGPVAPTARFLLAGQPVPRIVPPRSRTARVLAWHHYGLETDAERSHYHFRSRRIGGMLSAGSGEVVRTVRKALPRGTTLRLSFAARAGTVRDRVVVHLRAMNSKGVVIAEASRRVEGRRWRTYATGFELPEEATTVSCALEVSGSGRGWLDEVRLEVPAESGSALLAEGFEQASTGLVPVDWQEPLESRASGYVAAAATGAPFRGRVSLFLRNALAPLPEPRRPVLVGSQSGVVAAVPVALYADAKGTLPHYPPAPDLFPLSKPPGFEPTGDDRASRLAGVLLLGAALENFYPYPDALAPFSAALVHALDTAAVDSDERQFLDTLRQLTHALSDGHADVTHSVDLRRFRLNLLWTTVDEGLVVSWVGPEIADVQPGDVVVAIDGKKSGDAIAGAEKLVSGATAAALRLRALDFLAGGDRGEAHQLVLRRGAGPQVTVTVRCTAPAFGLGRPRGKGLPAVQEVAPGLFYVDFGRVESEAFQAVLSQLEKGRAIIVDLRGYPERVDPTLLLSRQIVRPQAGRRGIPVWTRPGAPVTSWLTVYVRPAASKLNVKVVFLTDEHAVSLAETVLQFVADRQLGPIFGSPTAGTQGEIDEMVLPGSYHVLWTGSWALRADGKPFRGLGVPPTHRVRPSLAGLGEKRDEVLDAAVAFLTEGTGPGQSALTAPP